MATKLKLLRCTAPGCRKLTARGVCDGHQAAALALALDQEAPKAKLTDEGWAAMLAEAERRVKAAAGEKAERRDELANLQRAAQRADRAGERPVFSHA